MLYPTYASSTITCKSLPSSTYTNINHPFYFQKCPSAQHNTPPKLHDIILKAHSGPQPLPINSSFNSLLAVFPNWTCTTSNPTVACIHIATNVLMLAVLQTCASSYFTFRVLHPYNMLVVIQLLLLDGVVCYIASMDTFSPSQ